MSSADSEAADSTAVGRGDQNEPLHSDDEEHDDDAVVAAAVAALQNGEGILDTGCISSNNEGSSAAAASGELSVSKSQLDCSTTNSNTRNNPETEQSASRKSPISKKPTRIRRVGKIQSRRHEDALAVAGSLDDMFSLAPHVIQSKHGT